MRTSAFLVQKKKLGFSEIYGVSARTREVKPVRTFCEQGGVNFFRFCADVFYGRPLIRLNTIYLYLRNALI